MSFCRRYLFIPIIYIYIYIEYNNNISCSRRPLIDAIYFIYPTCTIHCRGGGSFPSSLGQYPLGPRGRCHWYTASHTSYDDGGETMSSLEQRDGGGILISFKLITFIAPPILFCISCQQVEFPILEVNGHGGYIYLLVTRQ